MKHALFALMAVLVPGVAQVTETSKDTVAVMDFQAINAPASEASVLSEFVRSAVIQSGVYTVVDKKNMDKLLNEQAFQQTGCTSDECAVKLGRVLNVRKMVLGSYSQMGDTRFLTARLVDVETGKIEGSAKEKGFTPEDADTAAERLVQNLIGGESSVEAPAPVISKRSSRRALTEAQPVAPPRKPGVEKSYIMFFYGAGTGTMRAITVESLRQYSGIPIYKEKFAGKIGMEQDMAPFGFRAGAWGNIWGVDGEFSIQRLKSKATRGTINGVYYDGTSYTNGDYIVDLKDGWRYEMPIRFGMNLYLHTPVKYAFQPYAGVGFGFAFNAISSDTIQLANMEKFGELGIGFYAKFPLGIRVNLFDWLFLYGEYQPVYQWTTFSTTQFNPNWKQTYQTDSKTMTGGLGFYF